MTDRASERETVAEALELGHVHDHGTEDGPGLLCREDLIGKCLRTKAAALLRRAEPVEHPSVGFYRRLLAFYPPRDALAWFVTPHHAYREVIRPLVPGAHPEQVQVWSAMDMIERGRAAEVDAEINRLETGAYV